MNIVGAIGVALLSLLITLAIGGWLLPLSLGAVGLELSFYQGVALTGGLVFVASMFKSSGGRA